MTTATSASVQRALLVQMGGMVRLQFSLLWRQRALWAALLISLLVMLGAYAPLSWVTMQSSQIPANATYSMGQFLAAAFGLTSMLCMFFVAGAALEDRRRRVDAILFSRSVSSLGYTLARVGALVVVVLGILAVDVALAIAVQPWMGKSSYYPSIPQVMVLWPYVELYGALAVPAVLFIVPCAWLLAIMSNRLLVAGLPLFVWWVIIFGTPGGLAADLFSGSKTSLGEWLDPTGLAYAREILMQAFASHREASYLLQYGPVPLSSTFIATRILFVALGVLCLLLAAWLTERQRRPER